MHMRNSTLILFCFLWMINIGKAQDFPPDPKDGECYIRCPRELTEKKVTQIVRRAYNNYKVVPAVYKTIEEQVVVRPASKRYEYVPAVYREVIDTILIEEPISKISIEPVRFVDTVEVLEIQPAYSRFEMRPALANCKSTIPGDCDVICYVTHEAIKKPIPVQKILSDPQVVKAKQRGKFKTIKRKVEVSAATVREIEIPAEYITLQKRVLEKDETVETIVVGPLSREETVYVDDETNAGKESNQGWQKIDCKLLDYNVLPIYYAFNSDLLDAKARSIIDEKLYGLMAAQPNIRIEINSHTDSRDSDEFNLDLSNRRAKAVVDYLVSKGIKRTRLEYHGLGETELVNHCKNGVDCTEEQHQMNRRTEFRVLPK